MELQKSYIIEGIKLERGTKVTLLEEADGNGFNNLLIDKDGSIISEVDFNKKVEPLFKSLKERGLINEANPVADYETILRFCKVEFARSFKIPSEDKIIAYLGKGTTSQSRA